VVTLKPWCGAGDLDDPIAGALDGGVSGYRRHPGVDEYLAGLPPWQRRLGEQLRDLIHEADAEIEETVQRRVQPYFRLDGTVCALLAAKDHLNLFLYDGAIVPDPHGIITGGHGNSTARTVAFREGDPVPSEALLDMLRAIIANNRAGGWRRITAERPP